MAEPTTEKLSEEKISTEPTSAGAKSTTPEVEVVAKEDDTPPATAPSDVATVEGSPEGTPSENAPYTDTQGEESVAPGSDSITVAPGVGDSQFTTTSIVTTTGTEKSTKKRRGLSKIEAANVYVYGHTEDAWHRRDIKPSSDMDVTFRPNRAQTMRHSCIMKRTKDIEREQVRIRRAQSQSSEEELDAPDPITARKVPKNVYDAPKVSIKETKSSKFRYLYNRKPAGVKVYFKPANADPKKKPPFVVVAHPNTVV